MEDELAEECQRIYRKILNPRCAALPIAVIILFLFFALIQCLDPRKFSDDILGISKNYSVEPLQDYANQLNDQLDSFDIAGIQGLLKKFPEMQDELRAHLEERPAKTLA